MRQLTGPLICYRRGITIAEAVAKALAIIDRILPAAGVSHVSVGPDRRYKKLDRGSLAKVLSSMVPTTIDFALFRNTSAARDEVEWTIHLQICDIDSRFAGGRVINLGFGEDLVRGSTDRILSVSDALAREFAIESGHLHDLEDMSDQNQLGPHWFKVKGRPLKENMVKFSTVLQEEIVDVERNPCHVHVWKAVDFTSAWTVYLGTEALKLVDITPAFELGVEVRQLGESLFRVTNFEDPFAFAEERNARQLWNFRQRLRIDEIAHQFVRPF